MTKDMNTEIILTKNIHNGKIFVDTNVVIDLMTKHKPFYKEA